MSFSWIPLEPFFGPFLNPIELPPRNPLGSINKYLGRLDAALNSGGRTAVEWKVYLSVVGCGILFSMQLWRSFISHIKEIHLSLLSKDQLMITVTKFNLSKFKGPLNVEKYSYSSHILAYTTSVGCMYKNVERRGTVLVKNVKILRDRSGPKGTSLRCIYFRKSILWTS